MKTLLNIICQNLDNNTPLIVREALEQMRSDWSKPAQPIMKQEEFDALPKYKKSLLICNVIGCGNMVSTHGLLCVEHTGKY